MESLDAIVVGSGPNGLTAAVTLARAGLRVRVVEARDTVGGGTRSAEVTLPGFVHDVCSAIHPTALASPVLRTMPLAEHGLAWAHPELPLAHPLDGAPAAVLKRSLDETARELDGDGAAYSRLMSPLVRGADSLYRDVLGPLRIPRHPWLFVRFGLKAMRPADRLARAAFRQARARALFAGCAAHSVLPLSRSFSSGFALVLAIGAHTVGWPCARGGSQRIADALAAYFRELGGEIETGREVRSLSELPAARAFLLDVAPRTLAGLAGDRLPERYTRRVSRFRHGPGVFKVDWALSGPIPWRDEACTRAGTVHVGGTLEEIAAAEAAVWRGEHPERPFVLVAQQSVFDDTRAPAGKHTGWAYCHVPNGSTVDMTARIEAQVERFAPGLRDLILARKTTSPAELEAYNPNCVGGDIGGGSNEAAQLFARPLARLTPYATPNPAIYLCSSSTPPGGGVHGMCGYHAARAALRRVFGRKV